MTFMVRGLAGLAVLVSAAPAWAQESSGPVPFSYFKRFVLDGGVITWGILIPLSVITLALILDHLWRTRASRLLGGDLYHDLTSALTRGDVRRAWELAREEECFLTYVIRRALVELPAGHEAAEYAVVEAVEEQTTKLLGRIEYLNIIGNVSPMIGLFGTVYGIIVAFNTLADVARMGGVSRADQLAQGISVALVTTFWGLVIAIPALGMYGLFRNRVDAVGARVASHVLGLLRAVKPEDIEDLRALTLKETEAAI